jgi:tetratricopeptide (TPR) repeat protein
MPVILSRYLQVTAAIFAGCVFLPACGAQEASQGIEEHFRAAQQDQQAGQLDSAVREYQAVLKLDPRLPEAYANLGLVYYAQANFEASATSLSKANELRPRMRGVSLWLGIDYVKLNQPARAIPLLREAVTLDPNDKQAQSWLGTALWNAGHTTAAIDQLVKASALFPADPDLLYVLGEAYRKAADQGIESILAASAGTPMLNQIYGDIYREQRSWPKAIAHYQLALKKDPQWKGAHLGIGAIYLSQGKLTEAQGELRSELAVNPSSATAHALLAETALLEGNVTQALQVLEEAIRISPDEATAALRLPPTRDTPGEQPTTNDREKLSTAAAELRAAALTASRWLLLAFIDNERGDGSFDEDWKAFRSAVKQTAEPVNAVQRATLLYYRGQFTEAKKTLEVYLTTHPRDLEAQYLLAKTYRMLSLEVLARLMKDDPDSYRSHQLLAQTYENQEQDDKALAEYRIVEKMDPALPGIHFEIGRLLWKNNHADAESALEELRRELQLNPDHSEANGEIGTILVAEHEPGKAVPYLEAALRLSPDAGFIHEQLGSAYLQQKDYPRAEAELKKAVADDPYGSAHYQLALAYRAEGRRTEAAAEFETVRRIKEDRLDENRPDEPGAQGTQAP